jgi:hypothetical protein
VTADLIIRGPDGDKSPGDAGVRLLEPGRKADVGSPAIEVDAADTRGERGQVEQRLTFRIVGDAARRGLVLR